MIRTVVPPEAVPEAGETESTVGRSVNGTWKPWELPDSSTAQIVAQYSPPETSPLRRTETGWNESSENPSGVGAPSRAGVPWNPKLVHHSEAIGAYRTW